MNENRYIEKESYRDSIICVTQFLVSYFLSFSHHVNPLGKLNIPSVIPNDQDTFFKNKTLIEFSLYTNTVELKFQFFFEATIMQERIFNKSVT
ncbi:hypothetical protein BpHYR1_054205 [Brachionus plicatilis]|uniref:Uncharacterized protein n=1 Tax=Brachionus plicatilis TaxID=10195 RepID=A0A3M7RJB1_BRAPC|nr:hypothetical protein BpHYR1_054205 [Brachionus plicatilis]